MCNGVNLIMNRSANPKFTNDIRNLDLDIDVTTRLSLHIQRTLVGNDQVLMTPIAKEHGPDIILSELDKVFIANKSRLNETLIDLENSNRAKFGPRSIAVPWSDRKTSLLSSFDASNIGSQVKLILESSRKTLRPLNLTKALELLKNNTNSGLPYYTRKGKVKKRVLDKYDVLLARKDPCILFTRTQEQKKTRNVWGFPIVDTLNEMRYYSPLLSYQKRLGYRSALVSPEEVSRQMTKLINKCSSGNSLVSIDFASYDTSVKSQLQKVAFDYIKSLFQSGCESDLEYISERFRSISILTPDGIISGNHGVPSGSTFTNEVDSIVQAIIATNLPYVAIDNMQIQGDDGVYLVPKDKTDELFTQFKSFGLNVNEDKSYVSDNFAIYLQNLYHKDYSVNGIIGGIYPIYRALNRILFQERWSDFEDFGIEGKDYYAIRTICILENCKYHPLFKEIIKVILKYDKYSLDPSDQGISKYIQMIRETEGAGEILKHQYGDDVGGIKSFETIKVVKELS